MIARSLSRFFAARNEAPPSRIRPVLAAKLASAEKHIDKVYQRSMCDKMETLLVTKLT